MSLPLIAAQRNDRWSAELVQECFNGHALVPESCEINTSGADTGTASL